MSAYRENFTSFFHWFAWTIACLASLFFAFMIIGDGVSGMMAGNGKETMLLLFGLVLAIAGFVVTFFRKIPGGSMMLLGGITMVIAVYLHGVPYDYRMMMIYGFPYIFPGMLFIFVRK